MIDSSEVWSTTDYPYQCLRDSGRTASLLRAVERLVTPGDVVVDAGAGTGILSLAAAAAGAARVVSVELDPFLAARLRDTVRINGFGSVIEVLECDAREVTGVQADVLLAEVIDTGLVDEHFVPVMNQLWAGGVVGPRTRLLFEAYTTIAQLVAADHQYYGFTILAPKHDWPFYRATGAGSGWVESSWHPLGEPVPVWAGDFRQGPVDPVVGPVELADHEEATALSIRGLARLGDGQVLGECNSFNGAKVLPLQGEPAGTVRLSYRMGGGLRSLELERDGEPEVINLRDLPGPRVLATPTPQTQVTAATPLPVAGA